MCTSKYKHKKQNINGTNSKKTLQLKKFAINHFQDVSLETEIGAHFCFFVSAKTYENLNNFYIEIKHKTEHFYTIISETSQKFFRGLRPRTPKIDISLAWFCIVKYRTYATPILK